MCPWHRVETRLGDWLFANGACTVGAVIDPSERVLDCSEEPQVGLMQLDLKFCFGIRICLVNEVTLPSSRRRDRTLGSGAARR
jgi:hypothetical protein